MWYGKTISVVFPAYNEAANIGQAVTDFFDPKSYDAQQLVDEVIVVDNNSTDDTANIAAQAGALVVHERQQGYGNALQRGLREARNDLIVLAEPDGTFVAEDILKLLAYSPNFDMVCGTRTTREMIWSNANMGWFLRLGNLLVAKLMEVLYSTPSLSDCGCTLRLIHKDAVVRMRNDLHVGKSHILPNMIIAAKMNNVSMIEIPVTYRQRIGESKITGTLSGTIKTGMSMIGLILFSWPAFLRRKSNN